MPPGRFSLGCAVWSFRGWLGDLYPKGSPTRDFLRLYGERLTAVEGNTTFYATPDAPLLERWKAELPPDFHFCPKMPRDVTHGPSLPDALPTARAFLHRMSTLGDRLGPTFAQLPERTGPDALPELERFASSLGTAPTRVSLEVRHEAWFEPEHRRALNELLARHGIGRTLLDTRAVYAGEDDPQKTSQRRKPRIPLHADATASFTMVRFIGHPEAGRNEVWLEAWADKVDGWLRGGRDVYFFAHCPREECSPGIARRFQALLETRGAPVRPLPWNELGEAPEQLSLF